MTILAFVLFGANLLALALVLASQRITAPVCGGCGGSLAPTTSSTCEQCGGNLLKIGVTAGAVMRPPRRGVLLLLMTVLVVSLIPLLVLLVNAELDRREFNGPSFSNFGAQYGFSDTSPVTGKDINVKMVLKEHFAARGKNRNVNNVTWAGIELSRVPPSDAVGPPIEVVLSPDGNTDYLFPGRAAVKEWFQQEKIFLDTPEGEVALERSTDHLHSQILSSRNQSFSTGYDMNSVIGKTETGLFPNPRWLVLSIWIGMGTFEVLLLLAGLLLVVRFTRRSRMA